MSVTEEIGREKAKINKNKNYETKKPRTRMVKRKVDHHVTRCTACIDEQKGTGICHENCAVVDKKDCCVMKDGVCTVCGCPYDVHSNCKFVFDKVTTYEPVIDPDMKELFDKSN